MTTRGATKNYNFAQKNHWRRWVWNQAKKRMAVRPSDAIVLYLAGKDNLDLKIAEKKGFRRNNMFAIERDVDIVNHLRENRINVINGDLNSVLMNWGECPKIDLVIADFCCDINSSIMKFIYILYYFLPSTPVLVNMMRGRSALAGEIRKGLEQYFIGGPQVKKSTHRGVLFEVIYELIVKKYTQNIPDHFKKKYIGCSFREITKPSFFSYREKYKKHYMDSLFFYTLPVRPTVKLNLNNKSLKQRLAAAKAHRTMGTYNNF